MLRVPQALQQRLSDLLARIPLSALTVLDVGCGGGALVAAYRPLNPRAHLLGIEIEPAAAALAATYFDQIAGTDVEIEPMPFDIPDGIDCIIYNEILEHLRDPWGLIRRHAEALSPNGMMLICAVNEDHWRFTEWHLRGLPSEGNPQHGFTVEQMQDSLAAAGLILCDMMAWAPDMDANAISAGRFAAAQAAGLEGLGIDPAEYARRAAPSHLIWRVRKEPRQRMILSSTMLEPVAGVSHVRVVYPIRAIGSDPMVQASVTNLVTTGQSGDRIARLFILHRPSLFGEQGQDTLQRITDAGFLAITEFDDLPEHFDMMRVGGALSFYGAHALQTSTIAMADALRPYNREIAVFPNAMVALPEVANFTDPNTLTLFFGALNRERDWLPLMPAINAIAVMAGERLRFQVVHDRGFFEALATPHKAFTPICDHETYLRLVGGSEISFMPLSDNRFNRAKSDLKFIEAAACRTVALASSVVYGDSIEDGRTGLIFRDPVQFHAQLLRLLAMPEWARDLGDAARRYVAEERMLAYQVAPRIAWYRSLWARREVLDAARRERMRRYQTGN